MLFFVIVRNFIDAERIFARKNKKKSKAIDEKMIPFFFQSVLLRSIINAIKNIFD